MRRILVISLISILAIWSNTVTGIIISPENTVVIHEPGELVTFIGEARYGTPCYEYPHYQYLWTSNISGVIGNTREFTMKAMDLPPGSHRINLTVTDCLGETATDFIDILVVLPLRAQIIDTEQLIACSLLPIRPPPTKWKETLYSAGDGNSSHYFSGGNSKTLTLPPDFESVFLNDVCFDDRGWITVNGDLVLNCTNETCCTGECSGGCCPACRYPLIDITPYVHAGDNEIYGYADDCCGAYANVTVTMWIVYKPLNTTQTCDCTLNFTGNASGGLPPYKVRWRSSMDGIFDEFWIAEDGGSYTLFTTPPLVPPLSAGITNITFEVTDGLNMTASDTRHEINITWCCAVDTPCIGHWPDNEEAFADPTSPITVITGNDLHYSCNMYEVCHPDLWTIAREAISCCKWKCDPEYCHNSCEFAYDEGEVVGVTPEGLNQDGLKKCAGLYLIYGFGPEAKFMTDYFYPEILCMGMQYGCCPQDVGKCRCSYHVYTKNAESLPCSPYVGIEPEPKGWRSDSAMNRNTCMFADLPAHASILGGTEVITSPDKGINTGTCCDYANSLATMLRIVGYNYSEVYANTGPGHCYVLVKFPGSPKWNIIETTGNWETPYSRTGISGYPGYPYCSYSNCRNDAGTFTCPLNPEVWGC